ncbi:MAG: hypothetical protein RR547_06725, partial [Raoultibacter sp.]
MEDDANDGDFDDDDDDDADNNAPGFVSEAMKAQSLIDPNMPNAHGEIIEGANGGNGTIVRSAYLGKEMKASFLDYAMSVIV